MPVNIPRINRLQPSSDLPKNTRIRGSVQDSSQDILGRTAQIGNLASKGADIYQAYEDNKIDDISKENTREMSNWYKQELTNLKDHKGDPTDAYASLDVRAAAKYDELLESRPDLNERVKKHVKRGLDEAMVNQGDHANFQRGAQVKTYENTLYNAVMETEKEQLSLNVGSIVPNNKGSLGKFNQNMGRIKTLIAKHGLKDGTVDRLPDDADSWDHQISDADGKLIKYKFSPMAKRREVENLGKGIFDAIGNTLDSDETDRAKYMYDAYKINLTGGQRAALDKKFNRNRISDTSYTKLDKYRGLSDEDVTKKISQEKDGEIRDKMSQIHIGRIRKREYLRNKKEDANTSRVLDHIEQMERDGTPINSEEELIKDSLYKATPMSNSSRLTLRRLIKGKETRNKRKRTTRKNLDKATELFMREDLHTVPRIKITEALLTIEEQSQRNVFKRSYERSMREHEKEQKGPKVKGTYNSRLNFINRNLKTKLIRQGVLKLKDGKTQTLDEESNDMWIDIKDETFNNLSRKEDLPSEKEMIDDMDQFIIKLKKDKIIRKKRTKWERISDNFKGVFGLSDEDEEEQTLEQKFTKKPVLTNADKVKKLQEEINNQQ